MRSRLRPPDPFRQSVYRVCKRERKREGEGERGRENGREREREREGRGEGLTEYHQVWITEFDVHASSHEAVSHVGRRPHFRFTSRYSLYFIFISFYFLLLFHFILFYFLFLSYLIFILYLYLL